MKSDAELLARDATRDLGAELLASVRQMKRGEGRAVLPGVAQDQTPTATFGKDDSTG